MSDRPDPPRTVLPSGKRAIPEPELYEQAAGPVLRMAAQLATIRGQDAPLLLQRAAEALDRFDAELQRAGVPPSTVLPAPV